MVVLVAFLGVRGAAAQDTEPAFIPSACMFEGVDLGLTTLDGAALGFECGYVVVPERHSEADGATIRIPVAVRRATAADARPDPLLLAQGGPGGDAFGVFSLLVPNTEIAANRDIVIFNQRGTPYAEPDLSCPETEAILPQMLAASEEIGQQLYDEAIDACYARLRGEGIDLSAYNSLENAADIPLIARALGYETYNFYGVSYGTLLGLHLMRNHPEGLRAVILDSVVPPDINFISEIPASEDRVLSEVFAACEADPACREQYPDLEERFFTLVRQYNENPVTLALANPDTGERYDAYMDGTTLRSILFQLLYVPRMSAVFPKMVADLEKGDTRYIESMWPLLVFDQLVSEGMYYSVICAEDADIDVAAIPLESLRPEIGETARDDIQSYVDACARWQVELLPPAIDDPVISDIPTLLLSGRFDPITPPAFAAAAAARLSNATVLVDPTASHGVAFFNPCVNGIISEFLDDPTASPDSTCLTALRAPAAVPVDAITVPLLADVNSLNLRTLALFGLAGALLMLVLSPFLVWPSVYIVRAFGDGQPARTHKARRLRLISRLAVLVFGVLALIFAVGLLGFIVRTVIVDQTLLTALALPASAAPVLWLPLLLMVVGVVIVIAAVLIWRRRDADSVLGKIYYAILTIAAVTLLVIIALQGLLLPPL
ncbi:MAG: alpha/beta hydrolase [Candidatus Promineofilum sp.]|uniref:alpha/beta hydrolase n=1 Tax=Promineifilum sp. TaxID=2664178 RepID=UPI002411D329|nr:alpha/beta hydrolase [Promineifilum sp.]